MVDGHLLQNGAVVESGLGTGALPGAAVRRGILLAVSLALFCIQIDFFALNLAVPAIGRTFEASPHSVQWTLSAYMLSLGSLFILGGRLGDIFGRRRTLLAGVALFGGASAGAALAPDLAILVAWRVAQGAGAALVFPVGIAVLSNAYPEARRAKALGLAFAVANVGTALGPFVGGGLAGGPGWRWIFWLLVPLCVVSFGLAARTVPDTRDPGTPRRIDLVGAALVVGGVALLSVAVDEGESWGWASAPTVGALVGSAVLLAVFMTHEWRVPNPLIDLGLLRNLPFVLVTSLGAVSNVCYAVTVFVVAIYLQEVRGLSPLAAGAVFLAPSIMVALSGPLGARLVRRFRPTAVMAAAGVFTGITLLLLTVPAPAWASIVVFAACGLGLGLGWTFANIATQDVVRPERAGEASGVVLEVLVTMGGIGVAAASTLVAGLQQGGHSLAHADVIALRTFAIVILAWSVTAVGLRAYLVRRGLMAPLSMKRPWAPAALPEAISD